MTISIARILAMMRTKAFECLGKRTEPVDRKAIQQRGSRLVRRSPAIAARRLLVLFLVAVMTAFPIALANGQAHASTLDQARLAVEYQVNSVTPHDHGTPCNEKGHAYHNGSCCVEASNCLYCAPVPTHAIVGFLHREPVGPTSPVISFPSEVPLEFRPPKLIMTA
ncbi:hypothetical protein [Rhizobium bangladeshense]|uniref:hypothetical protein n=1 Tax=Rhizobium bangladeshense TaxID=1138189 RepID=UPI0012E8A444|nr:hypothetical protein [Rhizobium bangladeshense]